MLRNILLITLLISSACAEDVDPIDDESENYDSSMVYSAVYQHSLELADQHYILGEDVQVSDLDEVDGPLTCPVCKAIVSYVKDKITSHTTVETIKQILRSACDHLPIFTDKCKSFLAKYIDQFAEAIKNSGSENVCKHIGVC